MRITCARYIYRCASLGQGSVSLNTSSYTPLMKQLVLLVLILSHNSIAKASMCLEQSLQPQQWAPNSEIDDLRMRDRSGERVLLLVALDFLFACEGTVEQWTIRWMHREAWPGCATVSFNFYVLRQSEGCGALTAVGDNLFSVTTDQHSDSEIEVESVFSVDPQDRISVRRGDFVGLLMYITVQSSQCEDIRVWITGQITKSRVYYGLFSTTLQAISPGFSQPCSSYGWNETILPYFTAFVNSDTVTAPSSPKSNSTTSTPLRLISSTSVILGTSVIVSTTSSSSQLGSAKTKPSSTTAPIDSMESVIHSQNDDSTRSCSQSTQSSITAPSNGSNPSVSQYIMSTQSITTPSSAPSNGSNPSMPTQSTATVSSNSLPGNSHGSNLNSTQSNSTQQQHTVVSTGVSSSSTSAGEDLQVILVGAGLGSFLIVVLVCSLTTAVLCLIRCSQPGNVVEATVKAEERDRDIYSDQPVYDEPIPFRMDNTRTYEPSPVYDAELKTSTEFLMAKSPQEISKPRSAYMMTLNGAYGSSV